MSPSLRTVACPNCGVQAIWSTENKYRPFCSQRCRLIDLGQWAMEAYRVPQAPGPDPSADQTEPEG